MPNSFPDPNDWQRLKTTVLRAMSMAGEQQSVHLDAAYGKDTRERRIVDSILVEGRLESPGFSHQASPNDPNPKDRFAPPPEAGLFDDRYELFELLGSGTSSRVHRAFDTHVGIEVAIKVFNAHGGGDDRFGYAMRLRHVQTMKHSVANLVRVYTGGRFNEYEYIVMEYVPGQKTLANIVKEGQCKLLDAARVVYRLAHTVAQLHEIDFLHFDIKPENVLVADGDAFAGILIHDRLRITDFGQDLDLGTFGFLAPERLSKVSDGQADVFGLGMILFALVRGDFTSDEENLLRDLKGKYRATIHLAKNEAIREEYETLLKRIIQTPVADRWPLCDERFAAVIARSIACNPTDRYASVSLLADDLGRLLGGFPLRHTDLNEPFLTKLRLLKNRCANGSVPTDYSHLWVYGFGFLAPFSFGLSFLSTYLQREGHAVHMANDLTQCLFAIICIILGTYLVCATKFRGFSWPVVVMIVSLFAASFVVRKIIVPALGQSCVNMIPANMILKNEFANISAALSSNDGTAWFYNALADAIMLIVMSVSWIYLGLSREGWRAFAVFGAIVLVASCWIGPWLLERENSAWGSFFCGGGGGTVLLLFAVFQLRGDPDERAFQEWLKERHEALR